jgi:hypothetical protein
MAQKIDERFGVLDVLVNNARSIVESAPGSCEIAPWVSTEWSAEEVAAVVAFLASPNGELPGR